MTRTEFDVLIVGAGFAGLYMLHRARGLGLRARVLEAGSGVGGTWYWNRYPGARCDIESMQYSYQFDDELQQEWTWSERYASQPEILRYAEHVAERFDLAKDIRFDSRVESTWFDDARSRWIIRTEHGTEHDARYLVMATGCLSAPNWPKIPGLDDFTGPVLHTGLWPHDEIGFEGKRVGVIGTGSSAIQSIPLIAAAASQLIVFQRTANYSIPAHNGPLDADEVREVKAHYAEIRAQAKETFPGIYGAFNKDSALDASPEEREQEYERRWRFGGLTFMGAYGDLLLSSEANDTASEFVRTKIREIVDDPTTAEALCPKNIIGGKRLCVDTSYFQTYNRDNVTLIDISEQPIQAITEHAVRAHGRDHVVDVLVIATGFDAMTGALTRIDIRGRDGVELRERWADGPSSYLGLAMAGFPNLFTITGPGSPSVFTNMLPTIEQHVDWVADCLDYMTSRNYTRIEVERDAERDWWQHVQDVAAEGLKATTDSWYLGANVADKPRVFMPYYGGFPTYCEKCDQVVANAYEGFTLT